MNGLDEATIHCPSCGEPISILVDASVPEQEYIEDCQVCCRPIVIHAVVGEEGDATVYVRGEND